MPITVSPGWSNAKYAAMFAVAPLVRIALRVLVGEHRALGGQHRRRREVLRRDELDRGVLALDLATDHVGDRGVRCLECVESVRHLATSCSAICACSASIAAISSSRAMCRPPSNSVLNHVRTISSASASPTTRAPIDNTLASLCSREYRAV